MVNSELREKIAELNDQAILFDNPSFDDSIVGIDVNGCVVYSLELMVQELSNEENIDEDDAYDFIDYNTIRMLPYIEETSRPIIINTIEG